MATVEQLARNLTAAQLLADRWPALRTYVHPDVLAKVSAPQTAFLTLNATEALYGGAVGGGKTAALLMAATQYVDVPGYAALILRRTFPELEQPDGPIPQSLRWFAQVPANVRPVYNKTDHEWRFPSGAVLRFGHLGHSDGMIRYQGGGYHFFGFDELTHFDETAYEFIGFSRSRRPADGPLSQVPMRVRASANPGGPGHGWVKRRFITDRKPGVAFIPAKLRDNPGIDYQDYVGRLDKLSPVLRQQLLEGDWGAFEGAAFELTDAHVVDAFQPADAFDRFEALDYGLNGTPWALWYVDYDGNLVCDDMLYVRDMLPSDVCQLVLAKRKAGWGDGNQAWCDPSVWHRTGTRNRLGDPANLADEFSEAGVPIRRGNNDPRAGVIRMRQMLKPDPDHRFPTWHPRAGQPGAPRMFFRSRLMDLLAEVEAAPLQPIDKRAGGEIVDPDWESRHGHCVAMCRYAVMTRPDPSEQPEKTLQQILLEPEPEVDLRLERFQKHLERVNKSGSRRRRSSYTT